MQGYDSYFLNMDLQIGGADQTFNMQAGRTLQKKLRNKDAFVLTTEYLMGTDGRKMSKSWGNAIWIDDNPNDMFAKIMAINDSLIDQYFILATNENLEKIKQIKSGKKPMDIKKELATIIVTDLHSEKDAISAKKNFEKTVQKRELPTDIKTTIVKQSFVSTASVAMGTVSAGLASSISDAKRVSEQGGLKINNEIVTDPNAQLSKYIKGEETVIQRGPRRFVKIRIK